MKTHSNFSGKDKNSIFNTDAWGISAIGIILTTLTVSVLLGIFFQSGLGKFTDGFLGLLLALFSLIIGAFFSFLLLNTFSRFPNFFWIATGAVFFTLSVFLFLRNDFQNSIFFIVTLLFIVLQGLLIGLIWTFLTGNLRYIKRSKRFFAKLSILIILIVNIGLYYLLGEGTQQDNIQFTPKVENDVVNTVLSNFKSDSVFKVKSFYYGSGNDVQRPIYNEGIAFTSNAFDLNIWLPESHKFFKSLFKWFWHFNSENIPLNAHVWLPESDSVQHQLIFIVHGQENVTEGLEDGFDYLAESLSKIGYITVEIDLNFFNGLWADLSEENRVKAKSVILLKHLEAWQAWNQQGDHMLFNKLDSTNTISLIGHGEGTLVCWELAQLVKLKRYPSNANKEIGIDFTVDNIVALIPKPLPNWLSSSLQDINYLSIKGGYDITDNSAQGASQFNSISYIDTNIYRLKNEVYMHHANYAQFNERLPGRDGSPPHNWLINQATIMSGKEQRSFTKNIIQAFMLFTKNKKHDMLPVLQNTYYLGDKVTNGVFFNRFKDNSFIPLATFEDDRDPITTADTNTYLFVNNLNIWEEINYKSQLDCGKDRGLLIAWNSEGWQDLGNTIKKDSTPVFSFLFKPGFNKIHQLTNKAAFTFSMLHLGANTDANHKLIPQKSAPEEFNFSIEFLDTIGVINRVAFKNLGRAAFPVKKAIYKVPWMDETPFELAMQSYFLPMNLFAKMNPDFDLNIIKQIKFVFDKSLVGKILLDDIGFIEEKSQQVQVTNDGEMDIGR